MASALARPGVVREILFPPLGDRCSTSAGGDNLAAVLLLFQLEMGAIRTPHLCVVAGFRKDASGRTRSGFYLFPPVYIDKFEERVLACPTRSYLD